MLRALLHGNSEAWVVGETTGQVYGLVSTRNRVGDVDAIPMSTIFEHIKRCFSATEVTLSSRFEAKEAMLYSINRLTISEYAMQSPVQNAAQDMPTPPKEDKLSCSFLSLDRLPPRDLSALDAYPKSFCES